MLDHAYSFTSTKHLDDMCDSAAGSPNQVERILPATKYRIASFSRVEVDILRDIYLKVYPSIFYGDMDRYIPNTFRKMAYVWHIDGQKVKIGQYILVRNVFPFSSDMSPCVDSTYSLANARPAKVDYLFMHSILNGTDCINHMFAAVSWSMHHPLQHCIGKPYELWCVSAFETCNKNFIVPLCNFVTLLLTAKQTIHDENVLITVPLIL